MKKFFDFSHFNKDLLGGLTAGIVALPLALAFGEQSGMGAAAGLYGAAFIAFFASFFGGTPTQISGPTAPMTALSMVIIAGILQVFEGRMEQALPVILAVFLLAGLFQIVMGFMKLGTYVKFIPQPVVSGFMTGIGVIILITQLLPAIGYYAGDDEHVVAANMPNAEELILERILKEEAEDGILVLEEFNETIERSGLITEDDIQAEARILAANNAKGVIGTLENLPRALRTIDLSSLIELLLALGTIAIIYLFPKITKAVPSTLVALAVVSLVAVFSGIDYTLISQIPTGLPDFLLLDIFSEFSLSAFAPYIFTALMLALLGAIDSLLTSVVADNLTKTQHDPNQELVGQGIGNGIASFFGGLPGAGATIRTVVNIQAGGKTKLSGMIAGLFIFIIVLVLGPIASQIPAAVLAGILITVGIGVMDYKGLRSLKTMDLSDKIILLTVLVLTVFWQLVYAVLVGLVMAAFVFMKRMSDISEDNVKVADLQEIIYHESMDINDPDNPWPDEKTISNELRQKVIFKHFEGPLFFGMTREFKTIINNLGDIHLLVLRLKKVPFVDQSGIEALRSSIEELHRKDVVVAITGANDRVLQSLKSAGIVPQLVGDRHVFPSFAGAKSWLVSVLSAENGLDKEMEKLRMTAD